MASGPTQFVSNQNPLQLPNALRYVDANGNPVYQLYLTDFSSLVGSTTGQQVTQIASINQILATYQTTLTSLQSQITAIQTSGATFIPNVNGGCLTTPVNTVIPVDTAATLLIANSCAYNTILGTTTALAQAVVAQPSGLNLLPAFSQSGTMSGLAGWNSNPLTIAASESNQWIAYGDARTGISRALAAVTPTCSQVIVDAQVTLPAFGTGFNIYFDGYTFIPTGYTDNGSSIRITDSNGNTALNGINIITQSTTNQPYNFATSGTTLQSGLTYTVFINSNVTNSSLGLTCQKTIIRTPTILNPIPSGGDFPKVIINNSYLAQTGSISGATYSVVSTGLFQMFAVVNLLATSGSTTTLTLYYTDENGTPRSTGSAALSTVAITSLSSPFVAKGGTNVQVNVAVGGFSTVSYDMNYAITQYF